MVWEMCKQLQGEADDGQIKDTKYGLMHNLGGLPPPNVASTMVVGLWN